MQRSSTATVFETRGRYLLGLAAALFLIFALLPSQGAVGLENDDFSVVVPISTVVRAPEGSMTVISTTATPDHLVGETCTVSAMAENQSSVHPDNDLIIEGESGDVVLEDVEGSPGAVVTATGTIVLGEEIVITLSMGPHEVFSAGVDVGFACGDIGPTTTSSTVASTTTTVGGTSTSTTVGGTSTSTTVGGTSTSTTIGGTSTSTTTGSSTTTTDVSGTNVTTTTVPTEVSPTEVTTTTLPTEVLGTEVLPFTGSAGSGLALFASTLMLSGLLFLLAARSVAAED
jgi:hypothetical protein